MSHPFGDLIRQHCSRKHGLSQNKIAEAIDQDPAVVSRMCKGERLSGPQARERVVSIIHCFYGEGVLKSVGEANALLEAAGHSRLNADKDVREAWLLDNLETQQMKSDNPRFSGKDISLMSEDNQAIVHQLDEWKIVHSDVQELLIETLNLGLDLLIYKPTPERAADVERAWRNSCERKARTIRRDFKELSIENPLISDLISMLQVEQCLIFHIERYIEIRDSEHFKRVKDSFWGLKGTLIELLGFSDERIRAIAEELKLRYDESFR